MKNTIQITIYNIKTSAIIGCWDYERKQPQLLEIDLCLDCALPLIDELAQTVSYAEIHEFIRNEAQKTSFLLLESLAQHLVTVLLEHYPLVLAVQITLKKPQVCQLLESVIEVSYSQKRRYKVALALGSNLHNPRQQLISASEFLTTILSDIKIAPIYKSAPWGFSDQDDFYNTCISGYSELRPYELFVEIKKIEKQLGKMEQFTNGPRIIDIDLIFFANEIFHHLFLEIPHPRMQERDFVLLPLGDIEPNWQHPRLGLSVIEMLQQLNPSQQFILKRV